MHVSACWCLKGTFPADGQSPAPLFMAFPASQLLHDSVHPQYKSEPQSLVDSTLQILLWLGEFRIQNGINLQKQRVPFRFQSLGNYETTMQGPLSAPEKGRGTPGPGLKSTHRARETCATCGPIWLTDGWGWIQFCSSTVCGFPSSSIL